MSSGSEGLTHGFSSRRPRGIDQPCRQCRIFCSPVEKGHCRIKGFDVVDRYREVPAGQRICDRRLGQPAFLGVVKAPLSARSAQRMREVYPGPIGGAIDLANLRTRRGSKLLTLT